jgi:hypothetical protein
MTPEYMAFLRDAHKDRDAWRAAWTRDAAELLHWKRNAILRDPKTGKYVKKDRKP